MTDYANHTFPTPDTVPDDPPPNTHVSPVDMEMAEFIDIMDDAISLLGKARQIMVGVGFDDVDGMLRLALDEANGARREADHERKGWR